MEITTKKISPLIDLGISQSSALKAMLFNAGLPPVSKCLIDKTVQIPRLLGINQDLRNNIDSDTRCFKTAIRHIFSILNCLLTAHMV